MSDGVTLRETLPVSAAKAVPAVRRAASILWVLAAHSNAMSLAQIARGAGILPSTALQILRELSGARLIEINAVEKTYRLGAGLVELGQAVVGRNDFPEIAKPFLQAIALRYNVTATATAALDVEHTACVASVSPPADLSLTVTVGGRVPTLSGAFGRCIAAYGLHPVSELRKGFERVRWQTPLTFETWSGQVEQVRACGYAEDVGFFARGVTTLAAPVFGPDGAVAQAVGVASISAILDAKRHTAIAAAIVEAAGIISARLRLGGAPAHPTPPGRIPNRGGPGNSDRVAS